MFELVGWQAGVSYQAPDPQGLSRDYLLRLLDEMQANHMNLLSLMMVSQAFHDADHDGYAWPVRNPRLACYVDENCINARPGTEFVSSIIEEAAARGIAIQLFLSGAWWTAGRMRQGYPDAQPVVDEAGHEHEAHFCLDSPGGRQAVFDEALELVTYYRHPNVTSYAFEMVGFPDCACAYTQAAYRDTFGADMGGASKSLLMGTPISVWNTNRARDLLRQLSAAVRAARPGLEVWVHTQGTDLGHLPHIFPAAGVDTLLPLDHFLHSRAEAHQLLEFLAPNPCVVHLCARASRPLNYPLPPKTPDEVRAKIRWYADYAGNNLRGLMFFNEPAVPPANKRAVYEELRALRDEGRLA
jgi:hypothetical protein